MTADRKRGVLAEIACSADVPTIMMMSWWCFAVRPVCVWAATLVWASHEVPPTATSRPHDQTTPEHLALIENGQHRRITAEAHQIGTSLKQRGFFPEAYQTSRMYGCKGTSLSAGIIDGFVWGPCPNLTGGKGSSASHTFVRDVWMPAAKLSMESSVRFGLRNSGCEPTWITWTMETSGWTKHANCCTFPPWMDRHYMGKVSLQPPCWCRLRWRSRIRLVLCFSQKQVGPPGQGPGSKASPFRENTDTQFVKLQQSPVRTLFPPTVNGARPSRSRRKFSFLWGAHGFIFSSFKEEKNDAMCSSLP